MIQLAEVANSRLREAMDTLRSRQGMMDKIKFGTDHLQLFMAIGDTASDVSAKQYSGSLDLTLHTAQSHIPVGCDYRQGALQGKHVL